MLKPLYDCTMWSVVVVFGGCAHEAKVHEEFSTTRWQTLGRMIGVLFPNVSLFFKVNVAEGVVFERRWSTQKVLWEDVQLMFAGKTETECPNFGLLFTYYLRTVGTFAKLVALLQLTSLLVICLLRYLGTSRRT